jgi:uncharacterized protein YqeY
VSELLARLQSNLNAARKAQDKAGTLLLGTTLAELKNRRIELQRELTDDDVREVLRKAVKRRREAIDLYVQGNRPDLANKERAEIAALEQYLPAAVSTDELRAAVQSAIASGASNIGAVMGSVMPRFKGRADGATINAIAREELSKKS